MNYRAKRRKLLTLQDSLKDLSSTDWGLCPELDFAISMMLLYRILEFLERI